MSRSVSRSYVTRLFEVGTHLKNVFTLKNTLHLVPELSVHYFCNNLPAAELHDALLYSLAKFRISFSHLDNSSI